MEPERLHLPPQVLQLAPRQPRSATGLEGALQRLDVREELGRAGVGPADAQPGRREPMGRQAQLPSVGCVGQRPSEFGGDLGKLAGVPIQRPAQCAARRHVALGHRQGPGDPPSGRLHPPERMVGLDRHRRPRDLGGDGGVAVTIAPHPGAPSEERRERGRPRSTAFGVEGAVHRAIDRRQGHEDRLVEQGERRAHLIERFGTMPADRLRTPQPGDLLAQPAMDLLLIGGSRGQVLELFEQGADPPQVLDHGATLGLGGVGGQHRRDAQILERGRIHVQGVDRVLHRLARTGATRQDAQTLALLGQVHQLEVAGERADHVFGA